jgi:hypothetical protein
MHDFIILTSCGPNSSSVNSLSNISCNLSTLLDPFIASSSSSPALLFRCPFVTAPAILCMEDVDFFWSKTTIAIMFGWLGACTVCYFLLFLTQKMAIAPMTGWLGAGTVHFYVPSLAQRFSRPLTWTKRAIILLDYLTSARRCRHSI